MSCQDPTTCAEKAQKYSEFQKQYLQKAEMELMLFREKFREGEALLSFSKHVENRQFQRSVSRQQIMQVVRDGWPIQRKVEGQDIKIILLYHLRSVSTYRPLHVVCGFNKFTHYNWAIITAYDPRSMSYKWDRGFQKRICFC